jgi:hypothetical protein
VLNYDELRYSDGKHNVGLILQLGFFHRTSFFSVSSDAGGLILAITRGRTRQKGKLLFYLIDF